MHQDGSCVSAKTCAGAVANFQDVLTLTSHTTDNKTPPTQRSNHEQDQPTVTPTSSGKLAVNTPLHQPKHQQLHITEDFTSDELCEASHNSSALMT